MPKVLVLFYSRTGYTAKLADALVEGARSVKFTEVDVRRVDDLAPPELIESFPGWADSRSALARRYRTLEGVEQLEHYDGIILGAPTRNGAMADELKHLMDQVRGLPTRGGLIDKVGAAFTVVAAGRGGHETTLSVIMRTMAGAGMILCPPAPRDAADLPGEGPYGIAALTGAPGTADLAAGSRYGMRVATVTGWVHHARGHDAADAHPHPHPHAHSHPHGH